MDLDNILDHGEVNKLLIQLKLLQELRVMFLEFCNLLSTFLFHSELVDSDVMLR